MEWIQLITHSDCPNDNFDFITILSDSGKAAVSHTGLLDSFKSLLERKGGENLYEVLLDLLVNIVESGIGLHIYL